MLTKEMIAETIAVTHPISNKTAAQLLECTQLVSLKKGDMLEKENQVIRHEFIILDGIVRLYLTDKNGNEYTIAFYRSQQAIAPTLFRSLNFTSFVNIEVISQSAQVFVFSNTLMQETMKDNADLEAFGYKVMMMEAYKKAEREKILLTADGIEKLEWFRKNYPHCENEIPHYYIASFLGLTTTSLSRLRKKIAHGNNLAQCK